MTPPDLPSVLPSQPALTDGTKYGIHSTEKLITKPVNTTPEQLEAAQSLGKVTSPDESVQPFYRTRPLIFAFRTPLFICALKGTANLQATAAVNPYFSRLLSFVRLA